MQLGKLLKAASIFVLSCILIFPFHYHIGLLASELCPEQEVSITVIDDTEGNSAPVTMYYEGNKEELFLQFMEAAQGTDNWTYHEGERGKSWTYLSSSEAGASLKISIKPTLTSYLCFESNRRNGKVKIDICGKEALIDTRTESGITELLRIYPFKGVPLITWINIATWVVLVAIDAVIIKLLSRLAERVPFTRYIVIASIAIVYLLYYSKSTSPLYPNYYGGDSAFFILVGKGMKYGYLPYRDFYDMKGPWLFVLEWFGQLISEGRFGAFVLQCINLIGALIFFDKVIGMGRNKRELTEVFLLAPLLITAVFSVGGGNLTEELSLFPLSIVLYHGVKHLYCGEKKHKPLLACVYGFLFGVVALIRITNAAILCAVVLIIVIDLIINKEWKNLLANGGAFIAGSLVSVLPIVVFFASKGLLTDMIDQVFVYGSRYTGQVEIEVALRHLFTGTYNEALYPIYVSLIASLALFQKRRWKLTILVWLSTLTTLVAIGLSGRNFEHYYALLIPLVALDVWFIWNSIRETGLRKIVAILCGVLFIFSYQGTYKLDSNFVKYNIMTEKSMDSEMAIVDVATHISDDGSVYCWTSQPRWYMYADKFPSFKYCGWQADQMAIDPSVRTALSEMFLNDPPEWLVLYKDDNALPDFVSESRERFFDEIYANEYWILYVKKSLGQI